jgi:streptomycin 6-kinase
MLKKGRFAFDHINPDGLTGEPTLDNCQVLCSGSRETCHGKKTAQDVKHISKAKRLEAKHIGAFRKSGRPLPGSKASGIRKRMNGRIERF